MHSTSLKQQFLNYSSLFKQLFSDYYNHQKKSFWLIQMLMIVSTLLGMYWILSIIVGISHYQNPTQDLGLKTLVFSWVFTLPIWQWLIVASLAGLTSAWTLYISITIGVKSVLSYQKDLSKRCLSLVSQDRYSYWTTQFNDSPRLILFRILRQGIQLSGLVARRITRAFVALVTFVLATAGLIYLDGRLLILLLPLAIMYVIALYFINRHAARTSTKAAETLPISTSKFTSLVTKVLNKSIDINSKIFSKTYDESLYMYQAELKYQRRLAEIHVSWLNTVFLVLGISFIIIYIVYLQNKVHIDWQRLLFFLIALKYAVSSLQQISATTVAFSRFLPEVELVFRLLNVVDCENHGQQFNIKDNAIIYIPTNCLDKFEINQLYRNLSFNDGVNLITLGDVRGLGINKYFNQLSDSNKHNVVIDNNHKRLKKIIETHREAIDTTISCVIVYSSQIDEIRQMDIDEFMKYSPQLGYSDDDLEVDIYE